MTLVASFRELVQPLSAIMTDPTFQTFATILAGWVFARRHTVSRLILAAEAVGTKHHCAFHRLFAAARWSLDELGLAVFGLMLVWLPAGVVFLALDDTLARKRGKKVYGAGLHYDRCISTRKVRQKSYGHQWVVLGVILHLPFCPDKTFCLPILFRLYRGKKVVAKKGGTYFSRPSLGLQILQVLCSRFGHMHFHVLGDIAYGGQNMVAGLPGNCDLTSRLQLYSWLHTLPPASKPGQRGRRRVHGQRISKVGDLLAGRARRATLNIYGRQQTCRMATRAACLYKLPQQLLRVVVVESRQKDRPIQAFFSTCRQATPQEVCNWYAMRWSIEETFQASKTHLGFEEPQGWTKAAVQRTAPVAMLLYSLIVLWFAREGHRHYQIHVGPWYTTKEHASFADMLATLRCQSIREIFSAMAIRGPGSRKALKTALALVRQVA